MQAALVPDGPVHPTPAELPSILRPKSDAALWPPCEITRGRVLATTVSDGPPKSKLLAPLPDSPAIMETGSFFLFFLSSLSSVSSSRD